MLCLTDCVHCRDVKTDRRTVCVESKQKKDKTSADSSRISEQDAATPCQKKLFVRHSAATHSSMLQATCCCQPHDAERMDQTPERSTTVTLSDHSCTLDDHTARLMALKLIEVCVAP